MKGGCHTGMPLACPCLSLSGCTEVSRPIACFPPDRLSTSGEAFRAMDRLLDGGASGPLVLGRPEIAGLVEGALRDGERQLHRYQCMHT